MNITTLFYSRYEDPLLFNVVGENVSENWCAAKLFKNISGISQALKGYNINPGDRILILTSNRVETFEFSLAVFNIGAIAVPVNSNIGHDVLLDIVRGMQPKCCFYEGSLRQELYQVLAKTCILYISLNRETQFNGVVQLTYQELTVNDHPIHFGNYSGKHPALIIHTSGSQGRPKVIQLSHENLFYYFHYHDIVHRQFVDSQGVGELQKPVISVFHPSHMAAYSIALQGLLMRRPTYLMGGFSPRLYLVLLSRLGCRLSILVPSMYESLLKEQSVISVNDYSGLKLCAAVGEPSPDTLGERVEQTFGATLFFSGYGLTECLPGIAHTWEDLSRRCIPRGSSGKLLFEEVKLVDNRGKDNNLGELWLRNPTVYHCYIDDSLNQTKINPDGWFRTGDLFYRDENGYFYHKGRNDDMFFCNGKNIYPVEIESALTKLPEIEKAIAAAIIDHQDKVVPAVLIQTQAELNVTEVIEFFIKAVSLYALPKFIKFTKELPELGSGKIDRKACKHILQVAFNIKGARDLN